MWRPLGVQQPPGHLPEANPLLAAIAATAAPSQLLLAVPTNSPGAPGPRNTLPGHSPGEARGRVLVTFPGADRASPGILHMAGVSSPAKSRAGSHHCILADPSANLIIVQPPSPPSPPPANFSVSDSFSFFFFSVLASLVFFYLFFLPSSGLSFTYVFSVFLSPWF